MFKMFDDEEKVFFMTPRLTDVMSRHHLLALWEYDLVHAIQNVLKGLIYLCCDCMGLCVTYGQCTMRTASSFWPWRKRR